MGPCFGARGKASEAVHMIAQKVADARLNFLDLQLERPGNESGEEARARSILSEMARIDPGPLSWHTSDLTTELNKVRQYGYNFV